MYHSWLDRWDERKALEGEAGKDNGSLVLDTHRAFPSAQTRSTFSQFCDLAHRTAHDGTFYDPPCVAPSQFTLRDGLIRFPSGLSTDSKDNDIVVAKLTQGDSLNKAVVVFHHWNARIRQPHLAAYLARRGITVVEMAMPYHLERSRPGATHSDYMLSANLGRTIASFRQAVWDGRNLIGHLKDRGFKEISVLGFSLGSWIAGIVAAHDLNVAKASLFLAGGSLADMVWTGRATRSIRAQLEPEMRQADLNRAWAPLNLEGYSIGLARHDLALQLVVAQRDKVVLPFLSSALIERLNNAGASPDVLRLNCGHYSIARLPYVLVAGSRLAGFLRRR